MSMAPAGMALAGGGGGGGRDETHQTMPIGDTAPKNDRDKYLVVSQTRFMGMSGKAIDDMQMDAAKQGKQVKIRGFSPSMVYVLEVMLRHDKRAARRLVRDMKKIKKKKDRVKRLDDEIQKFEKRIRTFKESIKKLKANKSDTSKDAIKEDRARIRDARKYIDQVKRWKITPMEGNK